MKKVINEVPALTFDDVLIVPEFSTVESRKDIDTSVMLGKFKLTMPVISANMETVTGLKMLNKMNELGGLGILHRYMSVQELSTTIDLFRRSNAVTSPIAVAVGSILVEQDRINLCLSKEVDIICIDIAHGDSIHVHETLQFIRHTSGYKGIIIAGNICTAGAARSLIEAGADLVKVGVGPGSVCTTRIKTGCGFPQLQAILDVVEAVGPGKVIADGGIKTPGDAAKAMAAGAVAIMVGGMLAGTDCVPGWDEAHCPEKVYACQNPECGVQLLEANQDGTCLHCDKPTQIFYQKLAIPKDIVFRGMASTEARKAFGQTGINSEGISKTIKPRELGSTAAVLNELNEGLRSAMSYVGVKDIESFAKFAQFVRVTTTTRNENIPHH